MISYHWSLSISHKNFRKLDSAGHYAGKYFPVCTPVIKAILFLILILNPPQTSKSEAAKIMFVQKVT